MSTEVRRRNDLSEVTPEEYIYELGPDSRRDRLPGDTVVVQDKDGRLHYDTVESVIAGFNVKLTSGKIFKPDGMEIGSKLTHPQTFLAAYRKRVKHGVELMFSPVTQQMRDDIRAQEVFDILKSRAYPAPMTLKQLKAIRYLLGLGRPYYMYDDE